MLMNTFLFLSMKSLKIK